LSKKSKLWYTDFFFLIIKDVRNISLILSILEKPLSGSQITTATTSSPNLSIILLRKRRVTKMPNTVEKPIQIEEASKPRKEIKDYCINYGAQYMIWWEI